MPWSCPSLPVLLVTPLIMHTMCHAHRPCHGHACRCLHPSLPVPFVAHTLHHPHPSSPTPFITHTLHRLHCVSCHSSPMLCVTPITRAMVMDLVTRTMCRAPCHMHHVLRLLPMLWSCTSLCAPCVTHLVACAMHHAPHQ